MKELPKVYDPKQVESKIYDMWMRGGYFAGKADPDKKPFSIVMPPPNVTGQLHMGHALDATLQDILTRYKRMQGSKAVRETFCELYEKGLIYKGNRIINWCPHCRTALSDAEVEYKDMPGAFWYIRYPLKDSDDYLTIATTRPETMLGDTGIAVNPADERYHQRRQVQRPRPLRGAQGHSGRSRGAGLPHQDRAL